MSDTFFSAVKSRRTYYQLENSSPISDEKIHQIVSDAILHTPSSFNSQSTRVLILLAEEHEKLWEEIVKPSVKAVAPSEQWEGTAKKLNGFKAGYGTVLFYEDPQVVAKLQATYPLYADKFPQWSEHTNGMHTYVVWTALELEGLGANLQHYNPLIDQQIAAKYNIPLDWSLKGQLVFGKPAGKPFDKSFEPLEKRVFIAGGSVPKNVPS